MPVHLSLGSNVGDREENLREALASLASLDRVRVCAASRMYETEPLGVVDQPWFLNMAAEIETDLAPLELLDAIKGIEVELGRAPSACWGPRVIDIDIVLWDDRELEGDRLAIPHPEFRRRAFVLTPLAEIAGSARDPATGLTVLELAGRADATGTVRLHDPVDRAN